jgi:hypothetical protein
LFVVALLLSCGVHGLFLWATLVLFKAPGLDIEFQVPIDVELGLSEEVAAALTPPAPPPEPPPSAPAEAPAEKSTKKDKDKEKAHQPDAGVPESDGGVLEAPDGGPEEPDAGPPLLADPNAAPGERLPPGAQIAVRVDMTRIRNSPVAEDVRALLAAVPDWKALLNGSGIDPVSQLDRLLIATPNLQRDKIVVAGRFVGERAVVDQAVQRLAEAQHVEAHWHVESGVRVAPWASQDDTPRVIALVGPSHFVIARGEDLPRVLAIASARADDAKGPKDRKDKSIKVHPADALLSMEPDEGVSLEVDGVERFVRKAKRGVPLKLRLSAVQVPGPRVELRGRMLFETPEKAADALRFWEGVRDSYARNALVMLLGLSDPLREGTIELSGSEVHLKVQLSVEQLRLIVGYVRELITPPAPITPSPASPSAPSAPSPSRPTPAAPAPSP